MIDLHTHTHFSDGDYNPAEHIRRAQVRGYEVVAITDHADASTVEHILASIRRIADENNRYNHDIRVLCGVEFTHILPETIHDMVKKARDLGADLVNVHGETVVEPVAQGTNMAAIDAGADILCHPGLITDEEVERAAEKGVWLEITTRRGHCFTNGHVYKMAKKHGAGLLLNNDAHTGSDFVTLEMARKILAGCGMEAAEAEAVLRNSEEAVRRILKKGAL